MRWEDALRIALITQIVLIKKKKTVKISDTLFEQ